MADTAKQTEVIQELQRVAQKLGRGAISRADFARHGQFGDSKVVRTFGSWNAAVQAAGLEANTTTVRKTDAELKAEFDRVKEYLDKVPTASEFAAHGKIAVNVYSKRFGKWSAAVAHFMGKTSPPAAPQKRPASNAMKTPFHQPHRTPPAAITGRPLYGPPLSFRGLQHEPLNEQGVVYLFGMVARELGFLVESIQEGFPDCRAKKQVKRGGRVAYQSVAIEFEFSSSNFRVHGHDPNACDLVVCWEHDWPECPVQVVELSTEIQKLQPA